VNLEQPGENEFPAPKSRWRLNLALLLGSLCLALVLVEGGLRIAGIQHPPPVRIGEDSGPPHFYNLQDPYRGWAGNPNAVTFWSGEGEHGELRMNSAGFRDRERSLEKPEGSYRIALLGDSFVESIYLHLDRTYASQLERILQNCPGLGSQQIEVLNFGVQGYGTAQQLMTLRHEVWAYEPDLVLLHFYPGNDVRNNYRPLEHDHFRPYFVLNEGKLEEDLSFRDIKSWQRDRYAFSMVDWLPVELVRASRGLQLIRQVQINKLQQRYQQEYEQTQISFYREPALDSDWEQAWKVTEALILQMRQEVQAGEAEFAVVTVSDSYQVTPNEDQRSWFTERYNLPDLFYPDRRMNALGEREDIRVFNSAPGLWAAAIEEGECLHGFENAVPCGGHWNQKGSRIAAELVAEFLCPLLGAK